MALWITKPTLNLTTYIPKKLNHSPVIYKVYNQWFMQRLKDETYLVCCATYGGPYLTMMRTIIPKEKAFELADKLDTNLRRSKTIAICTSKKEVRRAQNRTLLFFLQEWCN